MSVRKLIYFQTALQAHKTLTTGVPRPLFQALSADHPYRTRSGNIRLEEHGPTNTFKHRAMTYYNSVPARVKTGSLPTVKKKLTEWILQNVSLDWG